MSTSSADGISISRFQRWLRRRIPAARRISLNQSSIFIFPSAAGFGFGLLIILLLLAAINYQNSLLHGLVFLLSALFVVCILHTYSNLAGLTFEAMPTEPCFAGEEARFNVRVLQPVGKQAEAVNLGWRGQPTRWPVIFSAQATVVRMFYPAQQRGWLRPDRILVETRYPLGLLRAWTWIDLELQVLVYPRPAFVPLQSQAAGHQAEGELLDLSGSDDFNDLRAYRAGDPVRHIHWPAYARTADLLVKEYASFADPRLMLDWDAVNGDVETRLSRLTGMALLANRQGLAFGLRLPGTSIAPGAGPSHLQLVLRELALYGN